MKDSKKMKNNVSRLTIIIVAVLTISGFVYSFCILSSSQGYPRRYRDSDIPFIYKLNNSTPPDWVAPIDSGAHVWEKVRSSYWEFTNGGFTPINTDNRDGTNLVFFDFQGVNFPPGTNTIAYSRTWTSGGGSFFHALESDLVWNARDFPPSPTGASGQQDLWSTIAHEFGHHLGMGHQGAPGGPPGCGETIQAATMYGLSASGDTTHRSLHIHDKAGVSVIYPSWILQGSVTDGSTGQPFEGVGIISDTLYAANTGPVESPTTGVYEYPGYVEDVTLTDVNGNYATTVLLQQFNVMVAHFGYATQQTQVAFNNPGGIGQTEVKTIDFTMDLSPLANISGTVMDMTTSAPVAATIEVFVTSDKPGAPSGVYADTTTGVNGEYSFSMPAAENYLIVVTPEPPYPMEQHMVVDLATGGQQVDFALPHADVLLVNDDISQDNESNIQQTLINAGLLYHTWRTSEQGSPDTSVYNLFPTPATIVWYSGDASTDVLPDSEQQSLAAFLDNGGRLLLTGQNIAETGSSGVLLSNYFGVSFNTNISPPIIRGVDGDPIGDGLVLSTVGGAGNQNSKDALTLTGNSVVSLNYGSGAPIGIAGVRAEDPQANWKAVFFSFGLEGINNNDGKRDELLQRSMAWLDVLTGIGDEEITVSEILPDAFELKQNYPNPFNPETTISFNLPQKSKVEIKIFNLLGQQVRTLADGIFSPGSHSVVWDGRDDLGNAVSSGVYFYKMTAENGFLRIKKMLMLK